MNLTKKSNFFKVCVVDLDGTILPSSKVLSSYTIDVFGRYRKLGGKIIIATGRNKIACEVYCEQLMVHGVVTQNGGMSFFKNKLIASHPLNVNSVKDLLNKLSIIEDITIIIDLPSLRATNKHFGDSTLTYVDDFNTLDFSMIHKIAVITKQHNFLKNIDYESMDCQLIVHSDDPNFFVITNKGNDKVFGIESILNELKVSNKDVLFFGNDFNDIETLKLCGCAVVPENADEYVKSFADYICISNENDGVAIWMDNYLKEFE